MKALTEKALLVSVIISQWSARKFDRKATAEVKKNHNTKDAGRFNKCLIAQDHLTAIQKIGNEARTFHYENTLPWSDSGDRLLPTDNYFQYVEKMSELKNSFLAEVAKFASEYPSMIDEARESLNGLFNANDYPMDIESRFTIKTAFMPVPNVQDLRVNISEKDVQELREQVGKEFAERFANAQRDIFQRAQDQLKRMHERLTADKGEAVFRNSLFENVLSLVDLLPRLNVTGDQSIKDLCNDLKSLYCDPDNVRNDKKLRQQKAQDVTALLSKMDAFFKPAQ